MEPEMLFYGGLGIAAVVAIVEAVKRAGMRAKYAPLLSLFVGMVLSIVAGVAMHYDTVTIIVFGFLFGGVASHGYDIAKKTSQPY